MDKKFCLKIQVKSGSIHTFSLDCPETGQKLIDQWSELIIAEPRASPYSTLTVSNNYPNRFVLFEIVAIWVSPIENKETPDLYREMVRLQTKFLKQNTAEESWENDE